MSSITVKDLIDRLLLYPDDYEVIMNWNWKERNHLGDLEEKHSVAMINGIERNDDFREVRLLN